MPQSIFDQIEKRKRKRIKKKEKKESSLQQTREAYEKKTSNPFQILAISE